MTKQERAARAWQRRPDRERGEGQQKVTNLWLMR